MRARGRRGPPTGIEVGPAESGLECWNGYRPLIRIREDFDDKVMQSAAEM